MRSSAVSFRSINDFRWAVEINMQNEEVVDVSQSEVPMQSHLIVKVSKDCSIKSHNSPAAMPMPSHCIMKVNKDSSMKMVDLTSVMVMPECVMKVTIPRESMPKVPDVSRLTAIPGYNC